MNAWANIKTIAKRELIGYFSSPIPYVLMVIFLLMMGFFGFMIGRIFERGEASLYWYFFWHPWIYILVAAVGMRMWSEERRLGTMELLLTMPLTPWQAIVGKFVASWAFLGLSLTLTFPAWITVNRLGSPDNAVIFCSYLGSLLMAGAYLAISSMTSAMTRNQVISFIVSVVIYIFLILAGFPPVQDFLISLNAPGWLMDGVAGLSVYPHFQSIQRGVIDSRDLIYFFSIIGLALFTTGVIIRNLRSGH